MFQDKDITYKSYETLKCFAEELYKYEEQSSSELLFNKWLIAFHDSLTEDFQNIFENNITMNYHSNRIILEDENAQGATICLINLTLDRGDAHIDLTIKYLVFQNRILILLDNKYAEIVHLNSSDKKLNKFFHTLKEADKAIGYYSPVDLFKIGKISD